MALGEKISNLAALAKGRSGADRERLLMAVVEMCEGVQAASPDELSAARNELGVVFMSLVVEAEQRVRQRLAERIADSQWAPKTLIAVLALDEIEIARPIIAASPLLSDADLVRLLAEVKLEHQIEVARRPGIGAPVVDAIMDASDPTVLTALAGNETADIQPEAMARLVDESRKSPALRSPLARHPRLNAEMAETLYAWVGDSLKAAIVARFQVDAAALDSAIAATVRDLAGPAPASPVAPSHQREAMERRLVDKLHEAGQLRSGYLLRALRERKLYLFCAALAKLGRLQIEEVQGALASDRPQLLALACLAAGIDRSVFPTILGLVRQLNAGYPLAGPDGAASAAQMFGAFTAKTAPAALREGLAAQDVATPA